MNATRLSNRIDFLANVASLFVAIVFLGLITYKFVIPYLDSPGPPKVGTVVHFADFNPSLSERSVILVLKKGCKFCERSMNFYKELVSEGKSGTQFIAVFPPADSSPKDYLSSFGINGVQIAASDLPDVDIDGTPTLLITDGSGKITDSWFGKLPPEEERAVKERLSSS